MTQLPPPLPPPIPEPNPQPQPVIFKPPARRGAPLGNQNAVSHGFYARNLNVSPPSKLDEFEMRNLMGEVGMIKDYMYRLYCQNIESTDPEILANTLRALSLGGMAISRMLLVHSRVRLFRPTRSKSLDSLLTDLKSSATRANRLASSAGVTADDEDDEDEDEDYDDDEDDEYEYDDDDEEDDDDDDDDDEDDDDD